VAVAVVVAVADAGIVTNHCRKRLRPGRRSQRASPDVILFAEKIPFFNYVVVVSLDRQPNPNSLIAETGSKPVPHLS
jgi:hypothetical protein